MLTLSVLNTLPSIQFSKNAPLRFAIECVLAETPDTIWFGLNRSAPFRRMKQFTTKKRRCGGDLLSHKVALAVSSALRGLTAVFGMGTGISLSLRPPQNLLEWGSQGTTP